jgi:RND family efflux transporter MFP subunit
MWAAVAGRRRRITLSALLLVTVAACGRNKYAPPPPPDVTVTRPISREITTYNEFTGYTAAIEAVEIRARVQGYLQSMHFAPGENVKQGQLLFVIEPSLYEARVNSAKADLQGKDAQFKAAEAQLEITEAIFQKQAGSRTDLVQKTQARDLAKAQLESAKATLAAAELDLSYTHIYAPIEGRIDRNFVDVGNLVGAGQATLLATVVRDDPVYAYFNAGERLHLEYRELQRQKRTLVPQGQHNVAFLGLATETGYPHGGKIDYVGNKVDPTSGTIEVRAVFPNPDHTILPGLFARVRVPFTRENAILVQDVAVLSDQGGSYVLTVDAQNTVVQRRVQTGPLTEGDLRVIKTGVSVDDQVIVNGIQRARPGAVVKPLLAELPSPQPPAASSGEPVAISTPAGGIQPPTTPTGGSQPPTTPTTAPS